jgi:hypothetical protein
MEPLEFDQMSPEDRRTLVRALLDKGRAVTEDEEGDLDVLLRMGLGMSEQEARDDIALRSQQEFRRTRPPKKMVPPWMR